MIRVMRASAACMVFCALIVTGASAYAAPWQSVGTAQTTPPTTSTTRGVVTPLLKYCPPDDPPPCQPPPDRLPSVSWTQAPSQGQYFLPSSTISLGVTASDPDGYVTEVEFYVSGESTKTDTTSPYTAQFTGLSAGTHTIYAVAVDNQGRGGQSTTITIHVVSGSIGANPNPCNIAQGGTTCTTSISWTSNSSSAQVWVESIGGTSEQLYADGQSGQGSASWITAQGDHFMLKSNGLVLASVDVYGNRPPTVAWSSAPSSGQNFVSTQAVPLGANASDPDGSVSKVEFVVDGSVAATDTSAPYATQLSGLSVGAHSVYAIAFDNHGDSAATGAVTFNVRQSVVTGYADGVSAGGLITGWACSTYLPQSINVDVYAGGPAGTGTYLGRYLANQSSESAVAEACDVSSGSYRYNIQLTQAQRQSYQGETIYVYGISPVGGGNNMLGGSGSFTLPDFIRNAQFVSQTVSSSMQTGATQTVVVTMKNNGNYTWTASDNYKLGSQNPPDNNVWGVSRVGLSSNVAPGQTATFTFTVTAPNTPGTYNFQWEMLQENVAWFGETTPNVAITVSLPPPQVAETTTFAYDELGRVIAAYDSAGTLEASYTYDANGNVLSATDGASHTTTMTYDALGQVSTTKDAAGGMTHYTYDVAGRVTAIEDPRGNTTVYTYDGFGQLWGRSSPDTGITTWTYAGDGQLQKMIRADGTVLTYTYDSLGRPTSVSTGSQTRHVAYDSCTDGVGRVCAVSDATGTTAYAYDAQGDITSRTFTLGTTSYALGYSYDGSGRIATITYPDGNQAAYNYADGRLSSIKATVNGSSKTVVSGLTWRGGDRLLASWTAGNGLTNTYTYDGNGRLTGIAVPGVQDLSFAYDAANRITGITNGINASYSQAFTYDAVNRLIGVTSPAGNQSYTYDANGNRTSQDVNGTTTPLAIEPNSNRLASVGSQTIGYDADGNVTSKGGVTLYAYDSFNRLESAGGATFYINPEGQRLRKSGPDGTTYFAPDKSGQLLADDQQGTWKDYVWMGGRMVGMLTGGTVYALHSDQTGRVLAITDASGNVAWAATGLAFDRNTTTGNAAFFRPGFPGQYWDVEDNLWHNGYRDYDPTLGRYIESDPSGLAAGTNTYAYVDSNPISSVDRLGLCPHHYQITKITLCSANEAFDLMRMPGVSAPGAPYAASGFHSPLTLWQFGTLLGPPGRNKISQSVNVSTRTITNTTLPGHIFYPGTVVIHVTPYSQGRSVISITGKGNGADPQFNNVVGKAFFGGAATAVQELCNLLHGNL